MKRSGYTYRALAWRYDLRLVVARSAEETTWSWSAGARLGWCCEDGSDYKFVIQVTIAGDPAR
jgi:hypothetical protein